MKKIKEIFISMILPRKMAKFRNMHFVLALIVYLVAMFIAIGSQFMVSENLVKKEMPCNEYEERYSGYQVLADYEDMVENFYVEKLEITSDTSSILDPNSDEKKLTDKILTATLSNNSEELDVCIAFYEEYYPSLLTKEEKTQEENDIINTMKNRFQRLVKKGENSQNKILYVFFVKDCAFYLLKDNNIDLGVTENTDMSQFSTLFNIKYYTEFDVDYALSYIRRLNKLDITSFVNTLVTELGLVLPTYSVTLSHYNFNNYTDSYFKKMGIYHKIIYKDNDYLDVTLVIDANFSAFSTDENNNKLTYFDYEGYFKQERNGDMSYVLCVFSSDRFYYVYNLGQEYKDGNYVTLDYSSNSIFETTGEKVVNRIYYLPNSIDELVYNQYGEFDTTKWTKKVGQNEQFDSSSFIDVGLPKGIKESDVRKIKPVDRHQDNFYNAIYTVHSRAYNYSDFLSNGFVTSKLNAKINIMLQGVIDSMIKVNSANYELVYGIMAFGIFILFPLLLVAVIWLLSRKLVMNRYRQYYAMGAVCYFNTSIIIFILGFFIPFSNMAFYIMFVQAWYLIFVTFRINTDPSYNNDPDNPNEGNSSNTQPQFKKIKEHQSAQVG